jgi:hypothetical protein
MANQFRNYLLTINNPTQTDNEFFEYLKNLEHIKYFVFQREKGEEKGTEHFQLYIEFNIGKKFDVMKKNFPTAHIEQRKGTKTQARNYCQKEETRVGEVYEYGEFAEERERTDLTDIMEMVRSGATDSDIRDAYPSQYFHNYRKILNLRQSYVEEKYMKSVRDLYVIYIYGNAGVGKTRHVMDTHGYENVYRVTNYGVGMFDTYRGESVVLFEEFRSSVKIERMLNYLDIYPLMLPARYGDKVACFSKVYICSNISLKKQYEDVQAFDLETYKAFLRRISLVFNFNVSRTEPELKPFESYKQVKMTLLENEELPFKA